MKYKMFGDVFQKVDGGITINDKFISLERCNELYETIYKKCNIIYRPSGILFYQAVYKHNYPISNFMEIGE